MQGQINPKIVGATIIGFALVAGAFTISSMREDKTLPQPAAVAASAPQRVAIAVTDSDNNGIEDWRDDFVTTEPLILSEASSSEYILPDTLTGKMSISFLEDIIRSRNYGPFGSTQEEIIQNTVDNLARETEITLYDTPDVTIMTEWDDQDIVNYANTVAAIIYNNNAPELAGELEILHSILSTGDHSRINELEALATVYQNYRDDTLKVPVPEFLVKQHLDLINTYHAIHEDIKAMALVTKDPAASLLRLKRYQDDATGLGYALQNMYLGLEPYAHLITSAEDPATLFVLFSPNINI
ncbi:MAG: hypothetical protein KBC35_00385 [Candidatus Pacebacteria bacterium]|nr:hypothetical protein [Candidatus Paceibacterota bacterium]